MSTPPLKVLLVEDDPAHAEALRRSFSVSGGRTLLNVVASLREFRAQVAKEPPDIAVIDLNLPDGRAMDALSVSEGNAAFPAIILTSHGDEQSAVEAMKAGALDYIVKSPEAFANLPRVIESARREWLLVQDRQRAEVRIQHLNTLLQGIRQVNQLITRGRDRHHLLQDACDILVETIGYRGAWIALEEADGALRLVAQAGMARDASPSMTEDTLPRCAQLARSSQGLVALRLPTPDCAHCPIKPPLEGCGLLLTRMEHQDIVYGHNPRPKPAWGLLVVNYCGVRVDWAASS